MRPSKRPKRPERPHGFKLNLYGKNRQLELTGYGWVSVVIAGAVAFTVATLFALKVIH